MSYILEALRKAERERRVSRVPTLDAAHGDPDASRRRPWPWPWAVGTAVVLGAAVVYFAWTFDRPRSVDHVASVVPASPPGETRPSPVLSTGPSAPPLDRAVAPRAPVAPVTVAPAPTPPSGVPEAAGPRTPGAGLPPPAPASPVARAEAEPRPVPVAPSSAGASAGLRPGPAPEARAMPPPGNVPEGATSEARSPAVPPAVGPSPEAASSRLARPAPSETPAPARFTLDVLVYSDAPAERLVFINGRKYVEGQAVDGETVVEQITPDGAVLRNAERRIVLSPKLNPYTRPRSP